MRSSNFAIRNLERFQSEPYDPSGAATYRGVAGKAALLVFITIFSAVASAALLFTYPAFALVLLVVSVPVTLISMLVLIFAPGAVRIAGTMYLIAEGILVGAASAVVGVEYGGVVLAALLSPFGVFGSMTALYAAGAIKIGEKFKSFAYSALLAVVVVNLLMFLIGWIFPGVSALFYGPDGEATWLSIGISVVMVLFAGVFILIDLSNIDRLVKGGFDKKYEWNAAFGLTVTLLWLYLEFLKLFLKIASRVKR